MPLAQLKGLNEFLSAEQKGELIRKVTDAIVSVRRGTAAGHLGHH